MTVVVYPSAIARACSVLDESPLFRDLPDGYLRVVVRLVKKLNIAKPRSPIVASRSTLATESGKSLETVGRTIKWLEERNLLKRQQKARTGLRGSTSPLEPTEDLLKALLLINAPRPGSAPQRSSSPTYPQAAPGLGVSADCSKSAVQKRHNHSENNRRAGAFITRENVKIPADLDWLASQRKLRPTAILALMGIAKTAQKRLSDVVAATRKNLEGLRGRELYAYLRGLIGKDRDYSYVARDASREHQEKQTEARLKEKMPTFLNRGDGLEVTTRDGRRLGMLRKLGDDRGVVEGYDDQGVRRTMPVTFRMVQAWEEGVIVLRAAVESITSEI